MTLWKPGGGGRKEKLKRRGCAFAFLCWQPFAPASYFHRAAELAEGEARALSKIDAALASQKALSAQISDIRAKDAACFRNAIILRALSDCLRGCVAFQAQLRSSR